MAKVILQPAGCCTAMAACVECTVDGDADGMLRCKCLLLRLVIVDDAAAAAAASAAAGGIGGGGKLERAAAALGMPELASWQGD